MSTKLVSINLPEASAQGAYDVIKSGQLAMGPKTLELEAKFKEYTGMESVFVSSGTAALVLALMAINIGPGDEVIVPSFTFDATAEAVAFLGAEPVFADIKKDEYVIDPESAARMMSPKVKAIIPVSLFGYSYQHQALKELGVAIIEDAAQSIGSKWAAAMIDGAIYSLYATKQLMAGEGGMFVSLNSALVDKVRKLRSHGQSKKYHHEYLSLNFAPTDVAAAIALPQFKGLENELKARRRNAALYNKLLYSGLYGNIMLPNSQENQTYHQYTIGTWRREQTIDALAQIGVETAIYYPVPVHQQPWAIGRYRTDGMMENTRRASASAMSIPVGSHVSEGEIEQIAATIKAANAPRTF